MREIRGQRESSSHVMNLQEADSEGPAIGVFFVPVRAVPGKAAVSLRIGVRNTENIAFQRPAPCVTGPLCLR